MDPVSFVLVFFVALIAALVDVMVGGGGLIAIPALGALGFGLQSVIATNRVYIIFFTLVGLANYWRKKIRIDVRPILVILVARSAGAYVGANAVLTVPAEQLKLLVAGFMVAAIVAILVLDRQKGKKLDFLPKGAARMVLAAVLFAILGYYEGFVGGGGGTISRILLMLFLGFPLLEAGVAEMVITIATSLTASAVFLSHGAVDFALLLPMVLGGVLGAWIGSHLAVKKGETWLRPLLFAVVGLLLVKLVFF